MRKTIQFQSDAILKWSAFLFSFSFCLGLAVNSISFAMFVLVSFAITIKEIVSKEYKFSRSYLSIPILLFFSILFVRELLVDPQDAFGSFLERNIAFLLLPLAIGLQADKINKFLPLILKAFVYGCVFNLMINCFYAVYRGFIIHPGGINVWYFTYDFLAEPFGIQPIYLSFFYVFSLFILYHFKDLFKNRLKLIFLIAITLNVFLLAGRNAIVCMIVLTPIFLIVEKNFSFRKILALFGVVAITFAVAFQNPIVKNRIFKVNQSGNLFSGKSLRFEIWDSAYQVAKQNPIVGLGKTQSKENLIEEYKKRKMVIPVKERYNAHNQYLQTLIQYGVAGVLCLALIFIVATVHFLRKRAYLGLFWLLLIALTAMTESIFMRQWGVYSFTFFTALFLLASTQATKKELEV